MADFLDSLKRARFSHSNPLLLTATVTCLLHFVHLVLNSNSKRTNFSPFPFSFDTMLYHLGRSRHFILSWYKLETVSTNRCLIATSTVTSNSRSNSTVKIVINGVQITHPDLFHDGKAIVRGIQGFVASLSPFSRVPEKSHSASTVMLCDVIIQLQSPEINCALKSEFKSKFTKPIFTFNNRQLQTGYSTVYRVSDLGQYTLLVANYLPDVEISMFGKFAMYNSEPDTGKQNYLSSGSIMLSSIYYLFSLDYCLLNVIWIHVLTKKRTTAFRVHCFMLVVVILKVLNILPEVEDKSSCNSIEKKTMFNASDAPFNQALKVLDKRAHSKLIAAYSFDSSFITLSLINVKYSQVFINLPTSTITILSLLMPTSYDNFSFNTSHLNFDDSNHEMVKSLSASYITFIIGIPDVFISSIINLKTTLSWLSTNTTLFFFKTKIVTVNNKTFFDNIDTFILVIPTFGIVAAIRSFLHSSPFAIDFISVHFLFDKLDFTLHKSNKISISIVTFFSLISQSDNNLHYAISNRIRNLEPDILSSTIVFSLLVPTSYNYDNKFIFDNVNTSIFIIPTSGTVATVRSSLHSSLFAINHFRVHFLFDKPSFAPHKSISISHYTFTLSSLIAHLNDNRHQVTHFHLQNANADILSSPHIALIFTSKISFDNTSFIFTHNKYSLIFTMGSISDLEDKVDFEGMVMIRDNDIHQQYMLQLLIEGFNAIGSIGFQKK